MMKLLENTDKKVLIIAEAGVNHNGDIELAKEMVDIADEAGADIIKFQTYNSEKLVTKMTPKAQYQIKNTNDCNTQYEMIKQLELSKNEFCQLFKYCENKKINFLSSPFDNDSIEFLAELGVEAFKIPSGDITNLPYLRKIREYKKDIIMSTGMANIGEIETALDVLSYNEDSYKNIAVLHCNTEYPTPIKDVNLKAIQTIKSAFPGLIIGYSDHTEGIEIALAAVGFGARIIEKHFTINKKMSGPDHSASLEPNELKNMIRSIRNIEVATGNGLKKPSPSEMKNIIFVRKSIVASKRIEIGEIFSQDNLCTKRPGNGITPMKWDELIGKKATKTYRMDDLICEN